MYKVLVVGASGLIGKALVRELRLSQQFQVYGTYFNNNAFEEANFYKLNIEDLSDIKEIVHLVQPQMIVSCLRGDFDKQLQVHVFMAAYLKRSGGRLYFCSTANVFDNDMTRPHYEDDQVNSKSRYGQFKIQCEQTLSRILKEDLCIMRLPQVWGRDSIRMRNLIKAIQLNEDIVVYPKLEINTISDCELARQVVYLMENRVNNIVHFGSKDIVTYKAFYMKLIGKITDKTVAITENDDETGAFCLLTRRRSAFPESFVFTNDDVIAYLTSNNPKARQVF